MAIDTHPARFNQFLSTPTGAIPRRRDYFLQALLHSYNSDKSEKRSHLATGTRSTD
jgi:hypothetical protein